MDEYPNIPQVKGYISIPDAAKKLGITYQAVHRYILAGRLKAQRIADVTVIADEDLAQFKRGKPGRPRTSVPPWRFSPEGNEQIGTSIEGDLRAGVHEDDFARALAQVKASEDYLFAGTIARYVLSDEETPRRVQFLLIWRQTVMPERAEIEQALVNLQTLLAPVLDWGSARVHTQRVWMHT
jgi:hypothetical protein